MIYDIAQNMVLPRILGFKKIKIKRKRGEEKERRKRGGQRREEVIKMLNEHQGQE